MRILDLSHWNKITKWDKIKDPVILKCTESIDYLDPTFKERQKILREKGLFYGSYHFFRDVDPVKQADFYLENASWKEGEILVLDFEINCTAVVDKCRKFLKRVEEKTGQVPFLYTNEARANLYDFGYPMWIARYGTNDGTKQKPPTKKCLLWQYTSRGQVEGILGYVDLNEFMLEEEHYGFTPYSQLNPRWNNIVIGKSGNKVFTIGSDGCFITSLSMMVGTPPDETFKKLKEGGAITGGGMIDSVKAAKVLKLEYNGKDYNINNEPQYSPSIKEVNYRRWLPGFSQHFVLRVIQNGKKLIIDPLGGVERKINYYPFRSYRLFKK